MWSAHSSRRWGEREVEAAESLLGEDAGFHIPAAGPAVAEGGRAFVGDLIAAFPDLQIEIRNSFTDGDKVVMELTMAGTQGGRTTGGASWLRASTSRSTRPGWWTSPAADHRWQGLLVPQRRPSPAGCPEPGLDREGIITR